MFKSSPGVQFQPSLAVEAQRMEFKQSRTALSDYSYALHYLKKLEAKAQLSEKRE